MLACFSFTPTQAEGVLHLYVLTGQSNSLGSVKGDPASPEMLDTYKSSVQMWNGNMGKGGGFAEANRTWQTVSPQLPNYGNLCMGPEYGFSYMMEKKGWQTTDGDNIAIIKTSLDGGGNGYWVKGTKAYNNIVSTIIDAVNALDKTAYTKIDLSGLMYLQGESDNASEVLVAQERYLAFLDNLKADLTAAGIDTSAFTESVLGENATWDNQASPEVTADKNGTMVTSRSEQKQLADSRDDIGWVNTRDLGKISSGDSMAVHYNGKSQITIGARYAYAMAIQQGIDVGTVRGDDDGVALNEAGAWWMGALPTDSDIAVWDVSSANIDETLTGDLALGGIRIEDTYRDETVIKNATATTGATLSLGAGGIELQSRSLSLQVDTATTAAQNWVVCGGNALSIGSSAAPVALKGNHDVTLQRSGSGTATFTFNATSSEARTWNLTDGVALNLSGSNSVWAANNVRVAAGASVSLGATGSRELTLGSLSLGDGAVLDFSSNLQLTVNSLTLDGSATFNMELSTSSSFDRFILADGGSITGATGSSIHFNFDCKGSINTSRTYTVFEGWDDSISFDFDPFSTKGYDGIVQVVNGNLVISFANNGAGWAVSWVAPPDGTPTLSIDADGLFDASAGAGVTSGTVSTLTQGNSATGNVYFFANASNRTGDVYAEITDTAATWLATHGSTSSTTTKTMTGNAHLKVSGEAAVTYAKVYGVVNGVLHGDSYMEFDAANATYQGVVGAYNGVIDGSLTSIVRSGTFSGTYYGGFGNNTAGNKISGGSYLSIDGGSFRDIYMGSASGAAGTIENGTHLEINGGTFAGHIYGGGQSAKITGGVEMTLNDGTFNGMIAGGNNGTGAQIEGDVALTINGGVYKNYVIGGGFAGSVTGDIKLTITGGDFSAMNAAKGIYAGVGSTGGTVTGNTLVTLKDIDDQNAFAAYTGIVSGGNQAAGTLTGTKALVLDNYTVGTLGHRLQSFDSITLQNNSSTTIGNTVGLGGATSLTVEAGSSLGLNADAAWDLTGVTVAVDGAVIKKGSADMTFGTVTGSGSLSIQQNHASISSLAGFTGRVNVGSGATATVQTAGAGATYHLAADATLSINAAAGNLGKLSGAGSVSLAGTGGTNTTAFGFDNWTGTVHLAGTDVGKSGNNVIVDFNKFGTTGSTIELTGFGVGATGLSYIANPGTFGANFVLTGDENGKGLVLNAGSSNKTYLFTGNWSGEGDFFFTPGQNVTSIFQFAGNMTGYQGDYNVSCGATLAFGNGEISAPGSTSGTGTITGSGTGEAKRLHVTYEYMNVATVDNLLTGNLDLLQKGTNALVLTAANDYTGSTTVRSGTMMLQGAGQLGSGDLVVAHAEGVALSTEKLSVQARGGEARVSGLQSALSASGTTLAGTAARRAKISNATLALGGAATVRSADSFSIREANLVNTLVELQNAASLTLENVSFDATSGIDSSTAGGTVTLVGSDNSLTIGALATITNADASYLQHEGKTYAGITTTQFSGVVLAQGATLTLDVSNDLLCSGELNGQGYLAITLEGFTGDAGSLALSDHLLNGFAAGSPAIVGIDTQSVTGGTVVYVQFDPAMMPEPSSATLGLLGLGALLLRRRRRTA